MGRFLTHVALLAFWLSPVSGAAQRHQAPSDSGLSSLTSTVLAPAQTIAVGGVRMVSAEVIAIKYWAMVPCGGSVAIRWGQLPAELNALSSWRNPTEAYGNGAANYDCAITLNTRQSFDWPKLCTVIVHEFGHLTGHQHSPDRADVMYATYVAPVAPCANSGSDPVRAASASIVTRSRVHSRHRHRTHR